MFDRKVFLVKERVGFLRFVDTYDIYDPATGVQIGVAREVVNPFLKLLRLLINKRFLPTAVEVRASADGPLLLSLRKGISFLRSRVSVRDQMDREIGRFRSTLLSIGGGFDILDTVDNLVGRIRGDWKGWNFRVSTKDDVELGRITKQWAGMSKELLTSADNYLIVVDDSRVLPPDTASLLVGAGLAIDIVFKEK